MMMMIVMIRILMVIEDDNEDYDCSISSDNNVMTLMTIAVVVIMR